MRRTPEPLLISAIVNVADPAEFRALPVGPEHFDGHRGEFEWITNYVHRFNRVPSALVLTTKFPDFNYAQDYEDLEYAAEEVMVAAAKRKLTLLMHEATDHLDRDQVAEAFATLGVPSPLRGTTPVDVLAPLLDEDAPRDTISVPWGTLQACTDGMDAGELWYVAARPQQGKSAVMLYLAAHAAFHGHKVIFYSLEMTSRALQERLYTILAPMLGVKGYTHTDLRRRRIDALEYKALAASIKEALSGSIHVYTPAEGSCTPSVINSRAADYDLSVVDYMGLMRSSTGKPAVEDWRAMAQISNELKQVALSQKTRILAASQVNREGDGGPRKKAPRLKNLSQSDALAQDGDVVITMNRYASGALHVSLEKNRHGESMVTWYTLFDPDQGIFREINRADAEQLAELDEDDD